MFLIVRGGAQQEPNCPAVGLVVRMLGIGGAENAAYFAYRRFSTT